MAVAAVAEAAAESATVGPLKENAYAAGATAAEIMMAAAAVPTKAAAPSAPPHLHQLHGHFHDYASWLIASQVPQAAPTLAPWLEQHLACFHHTSVARLRGHQVPIRTLHPTRGAVAAIHPVLGQTVVSRPGPLGSELKADPDRVALLEPSPSTFCTRAEPCRSRFGVFALPHAVPRLLHCLRLQPQLNSYSAGSTHFVALEAANYGCIVGTASISLSPHQPQRSRLLA